MVSREASPSIPPWLPNAISIFRVFLVPVWLATAEGSRQAALEDRPGAALWLVVILVVLGLSDVVDGWLARRFELTSRFGATLDAIADKLAQVAFVTYFAWRGEPAFTPLPLWFWGVIIGRDVVMAIGYFVLRRRQGSVETEHQSHGKAASVLLFLVVLGVCAGLPVTAIMAGVFVTTAIVVYSTVAYVSDGLRRLEAANES